MVEWNHPKLSVRAQCKLLSVHRSNVYRPKRLVSENEENIEIMHAIDKLFTEHPYYGYRRMTAELNRQGDHVNRKRVRRLMRVMGLRTVYPKPNLSKRFHAQYVRPYLLRNLDINRPNQVWGVDITYIRMQKGFMYLFTIIDWYSRKIIDYELSNTIDKAFVLTCLKRAFALQKPEIMNSDQGSHFTNGDYIELLTEQGVKISMDGKGQATDNSRTERFFRSLKYECIYLNEFESPRELRVALKKYMHFYNHERPHQALHYQLPSDVYSASKSVSAA
jgi:putative transposase